MHPLSPADIFGIGITITIMLSTLAFGLYLASVDNGGNRRSRRCM